MRDRAGAMDLTWGDTCWIRLRSQPDSVAAALRREFGAAAWKGAEASRPPVVEVTFEEVVPPAGAVFVGRSNAVAGGLIYVAEAGQWAKVPLGTLLGPGDGFAVRASPACDPIRLVGYVLEPLMRVRALACGHTFVHSSTVQLDGRAVLLSAWGNTGKTNLLLHFWQNGGTMLSDDWSVLMADGRVAGYPRPVNLMNYNLDAYPALRSRMRFGKRAVYAVDRLFRRCRPSISRLGGAALRGADMMGRLLEMASNSRLPLGGFGEQGGGTAWPAAALLEVHKIEAGGEPRLARMSAGEFAAATTACFMHENQRLVQMLHEFTYAGCLADDLVAILRERYRETVGRCLGAADGAGIWRLGIPARASQAELERCASLIRGLAAQSG